MKKIAVTLSLFAFGFAFNQVNAQTEKKQEIRKEVKVTEENGEKVMTIVTTENGKTKTETYKGAEADKKLKEMEAEHSEEGTKTTVKVDANGKPIEKRVEKRVIKKEVDHKPMPIERVKEKKTEDKEK